MNSNERLEILKILLNDNKVRRSFDDFNLELQNLLKIFTINFSGANSKIVSILIHGVVSIQIVSVLFKLKTTQKTLFTHLYE